MIRHIVFDMGNVLIPFQPEAYIRLYTDDPGDQALLLAELFGSVEWVQGDRGILTPQEAAQSVCRRLPEHLHQAVRQMYQNWHEYLRPPFADMEALARDLKAAGYNLYLLSNTSKAFHHFRKNIPALDCFDGTLISADVGLLKPNEEIFRLFCRKFDLLPQECYFIDDSPANVESALWVGMSGFIYRRDTPRLRLALREAGVEVPTA